MRHLTDPQLPGGNQTSGLAHLDGQNQLVRRAVERARKPSLKRQQGNTQLVGQVGRTHGLLEVPIDSDHCLAGEVGIPVVEIMDTDGVPVEPLSLGHKTRREVPPHGAGGVRLAIPQGQREGGAGGQLEAQPVPVAPVSDGARDRLGALQAVGQWQRIVELEWIDEATVARRWPSRLRITVTEQVPAAVWGERGLLNVRGELFVTEARHMPAELPRLDGPTERAPDVARRYLAVRDRLIPVGLDVRRINLDERGSWDMTLQNGVEVRLGRRDIDARTDLFLDVVADIITGRAADIEYVDMRYSNGFTIGWNNGSRSPVEDPEKRAEEMLALRGNR